MFKSDQTLADSIEIYAFYALQKTEHRMLKLLQDLICSSWPTLFHTLLQCVKLAFSKS